MQRDGNGSGRARNSRVAASGGDGPEARIDAAVMCLARLLGRQIARDAVEAGRAARDKAPDTEAQD